MGKWNTLIGVVVGAVVASIGGLLKVSLWSRIRISWGIPIYLESFLAIFGVGQKVSLVTAIGEAR